MKASLQAKIKPPTPPEPVNLNDAKVNNQNQVKDSNGGADRTSFKDLLINSNAEIAEERAAKKAKDYSNLSEEEFLKQLSEDSKPKEGPKNKLDKDDFLKLFVAQLQHQDPLNPDDGAEMASKLAQFNGLEQMMNVNKNMERFIKGQTDTSAMQLIHYIGKDVNLDGGMIKIEGGKPTKPSIKLDVNAAASQMIVRNSSGVKVAEVDLGSMPTGTHEIEWNGKNNDNKPVGNGIYSFTIRAKSIDGQDLDIPLSTKATITGVDLHGDEPKVYTEYGSKPLDKIKSIGAKDFLKPSQLAALATSPKPSPKKPENLPPPMPPAPEIKPAPVSSPERAEPLNRAELQSSLMR